MLRDDEFERGLLFADYPWMNPEEDSPYPYLVVGDDVDSLLSASLWNTVFPGRWKIIGVYHQYKSIFAEQEFRSHLKDAIWLDLDIAQPNILSIGHHILRLTLKDKHLSHRNGLNLNERRGIYVNTFARKYPLGTIHFLMYLLGKEVPEKKYASQLLFLADSTWINGQSHRFRNNVEDWLDKCIPMTSLKDGFNRFDDIGFEQEMHEFHEILRSRGIPQGRGQVASKHLGLKGYQCHFDPRDGEKMLSLLKLIQEFTGWVPPEICNISGEPIFRGKRKSGTIKNMVREPYGSVDEFVKREQVFSYVIPNRGRINFTCGIHI